MNIHFIQHEKFEAPGAYLKWAKERAHSFSFSKVYNMQPLPDSPKNIDLIIVLGGPQSPDITTDECSYFNALAEVQFIQKCFDADKTVLGVCLGSQLRDRYGITYQF